MPFSQLTTRLMPAVQKLIEGDSDLQLGPNTNAQIEWLSCSSPRLQAAVDRLLAQCDCKIPLTISCTTNSSLHPELNCDESYQLIVGPEIIRINSDSEWGVLRALASLSQLFKKTGNEYSLPARVQHCHIQDQPAFAWRGLMLDPARHFLPIKELKETLDLMYLFKLNVLHLHLTDDQGFRFYSRHFPELAELGSGGDYYRIEELHELVHYASNRGIRIVPELDIPGHCSAWLIAHPEWGARESNANQLSQRFGGHKACLDPANEDVYTALQLLIQELADVFPDEYIHLGGDEVNPEWWQNNENVQALMQREQLAELADVQNYFMQRVAKFVHAQNRKVIAWDEVLHPDLEKSFIVQSWRTARHRDIALQNGFDCVFSSAYYLDLFYPADIHHGFVPDAENLQAQEKLLLQDTRFEHIKSLNEWLAEFHSRSCENMQGSSANPGNILGGEACMWSELVTPETLHTRVWSRMPVIAERLWLGTRSSPRIYERLEQSWVCMKDNLGIDMYRGIELLIASFDLGIEQQNLLRSFFQMLEPVKSYARLLGDQADARVSGNEVKSERPYKTNTPLNRVVDILPPESLPAQKLQIPLIELLNNAIEQKSLLLLQTNFAQWQKQAELVKVLASQNPILSELVEISQSLAELGVLLSGSGNDGENLDHTPLQYAIDSLAQPSSELVLPVALTLKDWFSNTGNTSESLD